jgi:hypothetical protein
MSHSIRISQCFLALGLGACSGNVVNLGEGQTPPPEPLPSYSRCLESTSVEGDVIVTEQAQIDQLEGCVAIHGDLKVYPMFNPDLRPLHALQTVSGDLFFAPPLDELHADVLDLMSSVMAAGWLGSFAGLEALQKVGGLWLSSPAAADLEPLSGLSALIGGQLTIESANNLLDLAPLANLTGIHSLSVRGDQIESIADLQLGEALDYVNLVAPRLTELGELNQVRSVSGNVWISGTGLRDLGGLSSLETVGRELVIDYNAELRSLSGLENLQSVGQELRVLQNPLLQDLTALAGLQNADALTIMENHSLRRIPDFPALRLKGLGIVNNDSLEEVADFTGLYNYYHPVPGVDVDFRDSQVPNQLSRAFYDRLQQLSVTGNPLLARYTVPLSSRGAEQLVIAGNASLADLDLGTIATADLLSIRGNPALAHVSHALASVNVLSVLGNPALPLDSFDSVQTFQREMSSDPIPQLDCLQGECTP